MGTQEGDKNTAAFLAVSYHAYLLTIAVNGSQNPQLHSQLIQAARRILAALYGGFRLAVGLVLQQDGEPERASQIRVRPRLAGKNAFKFVRRNHFELIVLELPRFGGQFLVFVS
jgi:hypothetical protein